MDGIARVGAYEEPRHGRVFIAGQLDDNTATHVTIESEMAAASIHEKRHQSNRFRHRRCGPRQAPLPAGRSYM